MKINFILIFKDDYSSCNTKYFENIKHLYNYVNKNNIKKYNIYINKEEIESYYGIGKLKTRILELENQVKELLEAINA